MRLREQRNVQNVELDQINCSVRDERVETSTVLNKQSNERVTLNEPSGFRSPVKCKLCLCLGTTKVGVSDANFLG